MSMSVSSIMEDVNRCAVIPLVVSSVPVDQAISWMKMEGTAVVRFILTLTSSGMIYIECVLFFVQTSMSVKVMTRTTVMRMHNALIQMGAMLALATLATLEMG